MSTLRISDAPLLPDVDGTEKIPTGGRGDYAISVDQIKDHIFQDVGKELVGLGNVDNTSDLDKPVSTAQQAALNLKADKIYVDTNLDLKADKTSVYTRSETSLALSTKADLVSGVIPSNQLPSYVDDVVEYTTNTLPIVGESGKIYVTTDTNRTWRWSGNQYVEISNGGISDSTLKLQTLRKIANVDFDGTQNIDIPHNNLKDRNATEAHPASAILDVSGLSQQAINNQTIQNHVNLPVGLFTGQPAKFNGIQYLWDSTSTATPEDNLIIQVAGVSVGRWIIHAYDGCIYSKTVSNIQKAVDYCAKNRLKFVQSGDLTLSTDLYINTFESNAENDYFVYDAQSHKLHFTSGGLHFRTSRFSAYGLRVSTDDVDAKGAIILRPFLRSNGGATGFPVRFTFVDSWATKSKTNGWYMSNIWIGAWYGCYARYCEKWGVYLDHLDNTNATLPGSYYNISCNNLVWVGGEIQGNGKNDGSGGGVYHGRLVSGVWDTCIEGNYGDGVVLVGANNNVTFRGYIELNGSLPTNVDFKSPAVASPAERPRNIFLERTNHTPRAGQERSIDCYDIINLQINNPLFYGAAGEVYTQEPIRVRESVSTYASGKVINPTMLYNGYTQKPLLNECTKFGELKKQIVFSGLDFLADVDTIKHVFVTESKETMARYSKLTFKFITQPNTNLQPVRLSLSARGYPIITQFSVKSETVTPAAAGAIQSLSHEVIAANKDLLNGGLGWVVSRLGTHAEDTSTVPIQCVGAELEYYVGVV